MITDLGAPGLQKYRLPLYDRHLGDALQSFAELTCLMSVQPVPSPATSHILCGELTVPELRSFAFWSTHFLKVGHPLAEAALCIWENSPREEFLLHLINLGTVKFLAVLGLRCCSGFSLVVVSRSYSLAAMCQLLIVVASLVVEHGLWGAWVLVGAAPGF